MSDNCTFCKIICGEVPSWKVWEDENHIAFLTPTPNTPGFTVLITKEHLSSNIFQLTEERYRSLMRSAYVLSRTLEKALEHTRTALVFEGMGVDHAHVKLIPLHGIDGGAWKAIEGKSVRFTEIYEGYITSEEGPLMPRERLDEIARKIRDVVL
ncbi:MAG TPA: HIT family protein [Candidatus Kapabacteria bacterium]|nr:HIT family protein [Candidatus Kapabacteria bacterium]